MERKFKSNTLKGLNSHRHLPGSKFGLKRGEAVKVITLSVGAITALSLIKKANEIVK